MPFASRAVAESCVVLLTVTPEEAGLTWTVAASTTITTVVFVTLTPSQVAVIVAVPAATPLTRPLPFTVATAGEPLVHVQTRPVSVVLTESLGTAVSWRVPRHAPGFTRGVH